MDKQLKDRLLNRFRNSCSRREMCSGDILSKAAEALAKAGEDEECIAASAGEILTELKKDGYVDDLRYACAFVRDKSALTGWGCIKIRFALQAKKIEREIIDEALLSADPSRSKEKMTRLAEAKAHSLVDDPAMKLKLLRFLLGRGYSYQEAAPVVEQICNFSE
ncbi:MAG: regulatory protein RecX [Candidatus Cryptobacteroides sp.]